MGNEKLIAGAVMILLNLVVLAPIATSMVEGAVDDNFEVYPYDSACADSDCTTAEADWATSTSDRTYYAWNLTNADEVMAGEGLSGAPGWSAQADRARPEPAFDAVPFLRNRSMHSRVRSLLKTSSNATYTTPR